MIAVSIVNDAGDQSERRIATDWAWHHYCKLMSGAVDRAAKISANCVAGKTHGDHGDADLARTIQSQNTSRWTCAALSALKSVASKSISK